MAAWRAAGRGNGRQSAAGVLRPGVGEGTSSCRPALMPIPPGESGPPDVGRGLIATGGQRSPAPACTSMSAGDPEAVRRWEREGDPSEHLPGGGQPLAHVDLRRRRGSRPARGAAPGPPGRAATAFPGELLYSASDPAMSPKRQALLSSGGRGTRFAQGGAHRVSTRLCRRAVLTRRASGPQPRRLRLDASSRLHMPTEILSYQARCGGKRRIVAGD